MLRFGQECSAIGGASLGGTSLVRRGTPCRETTKTVLILIERPLSIGTPLTPFLADVAEMPSLRCDVR